jgi:uncharacterized protein YbjQ (UPF0145 family)
MSDENESDGEWDEKSDLTRIEDLSEFLHVEDDELNQKFEDADLSASEDEQQAQGEDLLGLGDLEDSPESEADQEEPPAFGSFEGSESDEDNETNAPSFGETDQDNSFEATSSEFDEETEPDRNIEDFSSDFSESGNFESSDQQDETDSEEESELFSGSFDSNEDSTEDDDSDDQQEDFVGFDGADTQFDDQPDDQSDNQGESLEDSPEGLAIGTGESEEATFQDSWNGDGDQLSEEEFTPSTEAGEDDEEEEQLLDTNDDNDYEDSFELPDPEDLETDRQELAQELDHTPPPVMGVSSQDQAPITTTRENFQDLRDFGNSITYGLVQTGGNPPYSLIVRQLKFEEDARDILILLREHGLVTSENEETISQGLEQGSLLISQISEYSAIYLAHRLRRFDLDLRIGLSDQLHPSKSYNPENKGLVSKHNLSQNFQEDVILEDRVVHIEDIVMATTPTIEGYSIYKYLDVMTSHTIIKEDELKRISGAIDNEELEQDSGFSLKSSVYESLHQEESDMMNNYSLGLNEIYQELSIELKNQAFKLEANAVVGINFALTPMIDSGSAKGNTTYKITCSGNAVWIVDKQS